MIVRPVLAGQCTLIDLSSDKYNFDDLLDLHEILDLQEYITEEQNKAQEAANRG